MQISATSMNYAKGYLLEMLIPSRIQNAYNDLRLVSEASYYKVFEATSKLSDERHTLRALDTQCIHYRKNSDVVMTLFIQEALYLCARIGQTEALVIENFEIEQERVVFVTKPFQSVRKTTANVAQIEKMINDVTADLSFLYSKLQFTNFHMDQGKISFHQETNEFFWTDWGASLTSIGMKAKHEFEPFKLDNESIIPSVLLEDMYNLGIIALEISGIEFNKYLLDVSWGSLHDLVVDEIVKKLPGGRVQQMLKKLLEKPAHQRSAGNLSFSENGTIL